MNPSTRLGIVQCGLAENLLLPANLVARLAATGDADICCALADRDDLTAAHVGQLAAHGGTPTVVRLIQRGLLYAEDVDVSDPWVVVALAKAGNAPPERIRAVAHHPDARVRTAIAAAPLHPDIAAGLAADTETNVVAELAASTNLTAALAHQLAAHPHLAVRRATASNERTPPDVLTLLATAPDRGVLTCFGCDSSEWPDRFWSCTGDHAAACADLHYALACNTNTPSAVAAGFSSHDSVHVRWAVAARTDLPPRVYQALAQDSIPGVRADLAANPAIAEALMRAISADTTNDVRRRLAHNPNIPLDLLAAIAPTTKIGPTFLPRIAAATAVEVEQLSTSDSPVLRMLLAEKPDLPGHVVQRLANDPDAKVLKSLAANPRLTSEQQHAIVQEHGPRVAARVAANPACPPDLLLKLAQHKPPVQKAFGNIAQHPNAPAEALVACLADRQARSIAARHPAMPANTLIELLNDPDTHVASAAATNPSLPPAAMECLANRQL